MNFRKSSEIPKINIADFCHYRRYFGQYDFPKIHPFWMCKASRSQPPLPCYAALACVIVLACVLWLRLPNDRRPTLRPSKKPARGARAKETRGRSMLCQRKCKERQKEWKCGRKRSKKEALNWQKLGEIVKSSVARPPATLLSFS